MNIMKAFYTSALAIGALAFAGAAFAGHIDVQPPYSGEPSLYDIAADAGFPNLDSSSAQSNNGYWTIGATDASSSVLAATWTGNYNDAIFGVYMPGDPSVQLQLLGGGSQLGPNTDGSTAFLKYKGDGNFQAFYIDDDGVQQNLQTANFDGSSFGFFLTIGGNTFYSDYTMNKDGEYRMVGYQGDGVGQGLANEYLFGWEDGSDNDYQDYVVIVESLKPVPEPAAIAMFGLGLLGLGFGLRMSRRRRS